MPAHRISSEGPHGQSGNSLPPSRKGKWEAGRSGDARTPRKVTTPGQEDGERYRSVDHSIPSPVGASCSDSVTPSGRGGDGDGG